MIRSSRCGNKAAESAERSISAAMRRSVSVPGWRLAPMMSSRPCTGISGCYLLRGMTAERIMASQLGRATSVNGGRDANLPRLRRSRPQHHWLREPPSAIDAGRRWCGHVVHLPRREQSGDDLRRRRFVEHGAVPRVAEPRCGPTCAVRGHRREQSIRLLDSARRTDDESKTSRPGPARTASPSTIVDGNDVEAVHAAAVEAVNSARAG